MTLLTEKLRRSSAPSYRSFRRLPIQFVSAAMSKTCQTSSRLTLLSVLRHFYFKPISRIQPWPSCSFTPTFRQYQRHEPSFCRHFVTFPFLNAAPAAASAPSSQRATWSKYRIQGPKVSSDRPINSCGSERISFTEDSDKRNLQRSKLKIRTVKTNSLTEKKHWKLQKEALKAKFPEGWKPRKRLSPDALDGIRHLHEKDPGRFTTSVLAEHFKVSPEAIRRILKSKWRPSEETIDKRRKRWERRNERIWNQMAEIGLRPERKSFSSQPDSEALIFNPQHIRDE